jgi:glycosyltransferase involved in cell wall biosynthesis
VDYELHGGPQRVSGVEQYARALLLLRFCGRPIGRVQLPVCNGTIMRSAVLAAMDPEMNALRNSMIVAEMLARRDDVDPAGLPSATVAICTRDRPEDLRRCLTGVLAMRGAGLQTRPGQVRLLDDRQDVLVVDNCPSDERSREVVKEFPSVRYVRESRPGLNHARNRALHEARGDVVAFIDDDAVPDPLWLHALLANYDRPIVKCVTGLTMPLQLDTEAQEQFESYCSFCRGFVRRTFNCFTQNPVASAPIGTGTNMSVRRDVTRLVGGFDNVLDAGTPTQSGGDHEMFTRILAAGYRIVYEPAALNWHRHRRTAAELEKVVNGYGVGAYSALLRALLAGGEWGALGVAYAWFHNAQLPRLVHSWRRAPDDSTRRLIRAELKGCLVAPYHYWKSVCHLKATGGERYA